MKTIRTVLDRIDSEIKAGINSVRDLIGKINRDRALHYCIHLLSLNEGVTHIISRSGGEEKNVALDLMRRLKIVIGYMLQLIYKYGNPKLKSFDLNVFDAIQTIILKNVYNNDGLKILLRFAKGTPIYTYEGTSMGLFLSLELDNPVMKKLFRYLARIRFDDLLRTSNTVTFNDALNVFEQTFGRCSEEIYRKFGLHVNDIIKFYRSVFRLIDEKLKQKTKMAVLNGESLPKSLLNFYRKKEFDATFGAYIFDYHRLLKLFESKKREYIKNYLLMSALNRDEIDPSNLRYLEIWRKPFLRINDNLFMVSPNLCLHSAFLNTHYLLLEDPGVKGAYIRKIGEAFLEKVVGMLPDQGITILKTNYRIKKGKRDMGDVDILAENENFIFVIECKGTQIPLQVRLGDLEYIQDSHLPYLKKEWEQPARDRFNWIKGNRKAVGLRKDKRVLLIIVSEYPEILSHFSPVLCLSLNEFKIWLRNYKTRGEIEDFEEFFKDLVKETGFKITTEETKKFLEDLEGLKTL